MSVNPSETLSSFEGIVRDVLSATAGILPCPVVVYGTDGKIIAASPDGADAGRLCRTVIETASKENAALSINCENSDESGIALPLLNPYLDVIGAAAALGTPNQVRPYAAAVKRQIEMILKRQNRIQTGFLTENAIHDIIQDFVNYIPGVSDLEMLETRARCLGFSPDFFYVPIVFDMHNFRQFILDSWKGSCRGEGNCEAENLIQSVKNRILMKTREVFSAPDDVSVPLNGDKYAVFCSVNPKIQQDRELVFRRVNENTQMLMKRLEEDSLSAVFGIGFFFKGLPNLPYAYRSATEAVSLGKMLFKKPGIYDIQNMRVESLLMKLSDSARQHFIRDKFTQFRLDQHDDELKNTILAYGMNFFNRQSTADALHIHRNTLNYRLKKIEERTNKSLHSFRDYIELYIACLLTDLPTYDPAAARDEDKN